MRTKEERLASWEKRRKHGMARYILIYGVFTWGIPGGVGYNILMFFINPPSNFILTTGVSLVMWALFGAFLGRVEWDARELWYNAAVKDTDREPEADTKTNP